MTVIREFSGIDSEEAFRLLDHLIIVIIELAVADIIWHPSIRFLGDHLVVVLTGITDVSDVCKFWHDQLWISFILFAGFVHQVDVFVLVSDRDFWMFLDPLREEDRAVELMFIRHKIQRHVSPSRFRPSDFVHAWDQHRDVRFLIGEATGGDYCSVDAVVNGVIILSVLFIFPHIVVSIKEGRA